MGDDLKYNVSKNNEIEITVPRKIVTGVLQKINKSNIKNIYLPFVGKTETNEYISILVYKINIDMFKGKLEKIYNVFLNPKFKLELTRDIASIKIKDLNTEEMNNYGVKFDYLTGNITQLEKYVLQKVNKDDLQGYIQYIFKSSSGNKKEIKIEVPNNYFTVKEYNELTCKDINIQTLLQKQDAVYFTKVENEKSISRLLKIEEDLINSNDFINFYFNNENVINNEFFTCTPNITYPITERCANNISEFWYVGRGNCEEVVDDISICYRFKNKKYTWSDDTTLKSYKECLPNFPFVKKHVCKEGMFDGTDCKETTSKSVKNVCKEKVNFYTYKIVDENDSN